MVKVAALYIDPRGPYPALLGPEMCWDEARDARTYAGPWPIVAHPPCGPWSAYAHMTKQHPLLFFAALRQVRRFGGVLEHPASSRAFRAAHIPNSEPDSFGGLTIEVDQVAWGHACHKQTRLYFVGISRQQILVRTGGKPTHVMDRDRRIRRQSALPEASHEIRRRTPPNFARWLIALASQARRP